MLTSIELFTGAGGLALGSAKAGFKHLAVVEWNREACASLRDNQSRVPEMSEWPIFEGDVRYFDFRPYSGRLDLLAAGAPCQPFSLGGKHRGDADGRNMFPQVFRAVSETQPAIVVVENVRGLLRKGFREYFEYIKLQLARPHDRPSEEARWRDHVPMLRAHRDTRLRYAVRSQLVNAADYGVPQKRARVFLVAFRSDLNLIWPELAPTHSEDALIFAKWVTGSYWKEHDLPVPPMPGHLATRVSRLERNAPPALERWRTVRDALRGLPDPHEAATSKTYENHFARPGARSYPGHTGSPLDEPAKTLKAGDHGVPGGENMLRLDDNSVRYLTVREAARLQCFPDSYRFSGAWSEGFRQLGNAVPVDLAYAVISKTAELYKATTKTAQKVA